MERQAPLRAATVQEIEQLGTAQKNGRKGRLEGGVCIFPQKTKQTLIGGGGRGWYRSAWRRCSCLVNGRENKATSHEQV